MQPRISEPTNAGFMPEYQMKFAILDKEEQGISSEEETPPEDQILDVLSRSKFKANYISNVGPHSRASLKLQ